LDALASCKHHEEIEVIVAELTWLSDFDQEWVKRASTDVYGQILSLHGAIEGMGFRGELLSYEAPTYLG
jgi:aromatic ring-opening dioxygenase LigB subunit